MNKLYYETESPAERKGRELRKAAAEKERRSRDGWISCEILLDGRPMSADEEQMFQEAGHTIYRSVDTRHAAERMVKRLRSLGWNAAYQMTV